MRRMIFPLFVTGMLFAIGYGLYPDLFIYTDSTPTRQERAIQERAERGDAEAQLLMGTFLATGRQGSSPSRFRRADGSRPLLPKAMPEPNTDGETCSGMARG